MKEHTSFEHMPHSYYAIIVRGDFAGNSGTHRRRILGIGWAKGHSGNKITEGTEKNDPLIDFSITSLPNQPANYFSLLTTSDYNPQAVIIVFRQRENLPLSERIQELHWRVLQTQPEIFFWRG